VNCVAVGNVVDKPLDVKLFVTLPFEFMGLFQRVFFAHQFEEQDLSTALHNQNVIVVEENVSEVLRRQSLFSYLVDVVFKVHSKRLTLSVEDVTEVAV